MILLKDLFKTFKGSNTDWVYAVKQVNLSVKKGEIHGIIGLSGAGKSTLIRCVNLLETPTSGEVYIDGEPITHLPASSLRVVRHKMGMIFQHFNLLSYKTVFENIALPLYLLATPKKEIEKRVNALMELTGLSEKKNFYPNALSGGQKQRVAIARALAVEPPILLCDEATSALDPHTTLSILELLKTINKQLNVTILLITHEIEVVKTICDTVSLMDKGEIIEQNSVIKFLTDPATPLAHRFVTLTIRRELPQIVQSRLYNQPRLGMANHAVLRILFHGKTAGEPLIAHLMQELGIRINILQANIDFIKEIPLGIMVVEITENHQFLSAGIEYLRARGANVEIMGYVDNTLL